MIKLMIKFFINKHSFDIVIGIRFFLIIYHNFYNLTNETLMININLGDANRKLELFKMKNLICDV